MNKYIVENNDRKEIEGISTATFILSTENQTNDTQSSCDEDKSKTGETENKNEKTEMDKVIKVEIEALMNELTKRQPFPKQPSVKWVQFMGMTPAEPQGAGFDYTPDRNDFVRLVFGLVLLMLLCTAGFNVFVLLSPSVSQIFRKYGLFILIPALVVMCGMNYAMMCSNCTRVPPFNYICLIIAVLCMSAITAYFTTRYSTQTICFAVLATAAVVLVCFLLACSSFDFTKYMLYIIVVAVAFSALAMMVSIGMLVAKIYIKPLHLAILVIGTLIQVVVLTMELQMILGGKTVELGEDEYALGAYMLYTSIIDVFIKMLQMIGMTE